MSNSLPTDQSSLPDRSVIVIVPAAGHGARFGEQTNKLFATLEGRPLWTHCVERLCGRPEVREVLVAVSAEDQDRFAKEAQFLTSHDGLRFVLGGDQRSDSVQAALNQIPEDSDDASKSYVAVHDAARPLIRDADLVAVFEKAWATGAAILAHPVTSTLKRERSSDRGCETVSREGLWEAQTPQVFRLDWMRQAYARHRGRPATDDAQSIERLGHPVALVKGAADNLKITYPEDLRIAEALLQTFFGFEVTIMTQNDSNKTLLDELRWRGLLHQITDEEGLAKCLDSGCQTVYIGFDPTASSLHVGSMMQLMMLRRFQRAGHRPIALVGGATGMIGDPSGKSEERNLLSAEQLQENVDGVAAQMRKFLDFDGDNGALLLNNFDWMKGYSYLEFLRDVGKNFPVGAMMGKESVRSRLNSEAGLSYTEFSYMLLQAYDFVYLAKEHGCKIQAGGSDQWGNITAGIDLGRRMLGQPLFGVTAPLLTTSDGHKMGKTESGAIWLDPQRTSPYAFYQYWINVADDDVMRCIAYLTEIEKI